jgi:hypothetical protein
MRTAILLSLASLSIVAGCAVPVDSADSAKSEARTAQVATALTESTVEVLGTPALAPVGGFALRADRITYVGATRTFSGYSYQAVALDGQLTILARSKPLASTSNAVHNMSTDGSGRVLFGSGDRNVMLHLDGSTAPTTSDLPGVFGKSSRHGNGGAMLRSGALLRVIDADGFGMESSQPVATATAGGQMTVAPMLSEGEQSYVAPGSSTLRMVRSVTTGTTVSSRCGLWGYYDTSGPIATAHDAAAGTMRTVARASDGRAVVCSGSMTSATARYVSLPFAAVADFAFEGGGGIGLWDGFEGGGGIQPAPDAFDPSGGLGFEGGGGIKPAPFDYEGGGGLGFEGGGGLGMWFASRDTAEVAFVKGGTVQRMALTTYKPGSTEYALSIPKNVRSFSDGSAVVLTRDNRFLRVRRAQ